MTLRTKITLAVAITSLLASCGGGGPASTAIAASEIPFQETAFDAAKDFLTKLDVLRASSPTSSAAYFALTDGCYLGDGRSKAYLTTDFDSDPQAVASRQFVIGSTHTAPQVTAERSITNADGSARREIDIKYVVNYQDGTKAEIGGDTIVSGSTSGSRVADGSTCATPDSKKDWRFYGNRRVVQTFVTATNERVERTALATGLPLNPAVVYGKFVSFGLVDPAKLATYATVTGPGLGLGTSGALNGTIGAVKLLSVRLLRSAPELAGKRGNVVDLLDTDSFRVCSNLAGTGFASADTANCVGDGTAGNIIGSFNNVSGSALDASFAALNVNAGDVYTINVYADDGWKTVNGQAGKTPIATYTNTLAALPFSAAVLAGTSPSADLFARVTSSTKSPAEIAAAFRAKAAISVGQSWSVAGAMPDSRALALSRNYSFESGQANSTGANFPASSKTDFGYPGSLATLVIVNIPAPTAALVIPTFAETTLQFINRNGNSINSRYSYQ